MKINMNKTFSVLLLLFLVYFGSTAQEYKQTIRTNFNDYLNFIVNKQFDRSMDYLSPSFFEIFPRVQMVQMMEQTFNNPDLLINLKDPKILRVDDAQKIDGSYYAMLTYSNVMEMKMLGNTDETDEAKEQRISMTRMSFNQTFGTDNVSYDQETDLFKIYSQKDVYAISENGSSDWKFVVVEKAQKPILERLLPGELIDKL